MIWFVILFRFISFHLSFWWGFWQWRRCIGWSCWRSHCVNYIGISAHSAENWLAWFKFFDTFLALWFLLHGEAILWWLVIGELHICLLSRSLLTLWVFISSNYIRSFHDDLDFILRVNYFWLLLDLDTRLNQYLFLELLYWLNLDYFPMWILCYPQSYRISVIKTTTETLGCQFFRFWFRDVKYFFVDSLFAQVFSQWCTLFLKLNVLFRFYFSWKFKKLISWLTSLCWTYPASSSSTSLTLLVIIWH